MKLRRRKKNRSTSTVSFFACKSLNQQNLQGNAEQHQWEREHIWTWCTGWFTNPWTLSSGNTACADVRWVAYFPFCRRERQKFIAAVVSQWIFIAQRILSAASILFTYFIWFRALTLWVNKSFCSAINLPGLPFPYFFTAVTWNSTKLIR